MRCARGALSKQAQLIEITPGGELATNRRVTDNKKSQHEAIRPGTHNCSNNNMMNRPIYADGNSDKLLLSSLC